MTSGIVHEWCNDIQYCQDTRNDIPLCQLTESVNFTEICLMYVHTCYLTDICTIYNSSRMVVVHFCIFTEYCKFYIDLSWVHPTMSYNRNMSNLLCKLEWLTSVCVTLLFLFQSNGECTFYRNVSILLKSVMACRQSPRVHSARRTRAECCGDAAPVFSHQQSAVLTPTSCQ
jgi:hypothetical protein